MLSLVAMTHKIGVCLTCENPRVGAVGGEVGVLHSETVPAVEAVVSVEPQESALGRCCP